LHIHIQGDSGEDASTESAVDREQKNNDYEKRILKCGAAVMESAVLRSLRGGLIDRKMSL
jgi:hypothetical protein